MCTRWLYVVPSLALKYIIVRQLKQAIIISDSHSALLSLASVHERRVIINEIEDNIKEHTGDFQLIWVKSHREFEGNKHVDQWKIWPGLKIMWIFLSVFLEFRLKMSLKGKLWKHGKSVGQMVLKLD
ncbi:hypothetical protein AVEN_254162-1 [Araneus ventricosus]|uniref:RNase H type-1 domain-containing protein n=1 Tax=Araneus ventricosus TaxID=182803 RepID=A0A4Y2T0L8_ARAVE|nr:hypothetical protein AVEN_59633-1 [Araneus ventricosus]GBN84591.1 hypothetical protein AVEN_39345-1 [Araneus ventricosus]GBN94142.1 hypothetical protein AVEN_254162-1 [Araneus ventricosus]